MLELNHYQPKYFNSLIERITIAKTTGSEFNLMFIPTHFVTLFIPLNNSAIYYDGVCYSKPVIKNILLKPAYLRIPENAYVLGIRFYPFGTLPFSDILTSDTNYKGITDDNEIIEQVFASLRKNYKSEKEQQITLLKEFYYYLLKKEEICSVQNFCDKRAINYISLYRAFQKLLNISPKKFERLIKFRLSVDYMIWEKQKLFDISFDSGYYDQAHFSKEFKYFVKMTPSGYVKYLSDNYLYDYDEFANFTSLRM